MSARPAVLAAGTFVLLGTVQPGVAEVGGFDAAKIEKAIPGIERCVAYDQPRSLAGCTR